MYFLSQSKERKHLQCPSKSLCTGRKHVLEYNRLTSTWSSTVVCECACYLHLALQYIHTKRALNVRLARERTAPGHLADGHLTDGTSGRWTFGRSYYVLIISDYF